ncbi:MAG: MipA/OmpV family protein [Pseudomonadota bacterium]
MVSWRHADGGARGTDILELPDARPRPVTRALLPLALMIGCLLAPQARTQAMQVPDSGNQAKGLPLWEIGAGFGGAYTPDYPGAVSETARGLPLPVVIYRGDFLRIGDGSVASGRLFQDDRYQLDISLNGSFDAESDDVGARAGMPDLGFVFEVGPELEVQLVQSSDGMRRLKFELPVRAAFSFDDDGLRDRGFVTSPELQYEHEFADRRFEWSLSVAPSFATESLQSYFFDVRPEFATETRAAFEASGGYLQTRIGLGLQWRGDGRFAAAGVSYSLFNGSANRDSPLFEQDYGISIGVIFVQRLWQSKKRVKPRQTTKPSKTQDR